MTQVSWPMFLMYCYFTAFVFIAGIYCILATRRLIRIMIGLELLTKGVTLLLIAVGYLMNNTGLTQALVITLIVIEVVVIATMGGIVLSVYRVHNSLESKYLRKLKW
ncbi:MAG: NADH-quinone oxidoreductase subunit K [Candidatus Omnitrophica bacterium]|nr:NADH-quinone oxidoreductase subunit K [Candidatus Omnitrophota bacterium]